MSILFMDGFDTASPGNILTKWTSGSIGAVQTGRFDYGQAVRFMGTSLVKTLAGNHQTLGMAFGVRINTTFAATMLVGLRDAGSYQCEVKIRADGKIDLTRNGTLIATSLNPLNLATWYHLEFKVYLHDTAGTAELRVNGASFVAVSGADTKNTANASANEIVITSQNGGVPIDYDDLVVWNTSGSLNNDWLGDCRIFTQFPSGPGSYSQWTPSAGSNYQNVDDNPADGDATWNSAASADYKDSYAFTDIPGVGTIRAVAAHIVARKDDAGARVVAHLLRRGSDVLGTNLNLADAYALYSYLWETDPITAAAWTLANLNNTEFGVKLVA